MQSANDSGPNLQPFVVSRAAAWSISVRRGQKRDGPGSPASAPGIVGLIAAVVLAGCGYVQKPLFPLDVRTVAVPVFDNRSFYQGVERDVTEAVIKEIELATPYKVVANDRADTQIDAIITRVDQNRLSRTVEGGFPQELELRIRLNFEWQDLRSGKILRQRHGFEAVGRYIPANPVGEPYQIAQHDAAQRLARQIVAVMGSEW